MKEILLFVRPNGILKEANPLPVPTPGPTFKELTEAYNKADDELPAYMVKNMICDSGMQVCGSVLAFRPGTKFKARILGGNTVQIF